MAFASQLAARPSIRPARLLLVKRSATTLDMHVVQVCIQAFTQVQAERVLACMRLKSWTVAVHLVDDSEMAELNDEHRGKNKATDVLSFPVGVGRGGEGGKHARNTSMISTSTSTSTTPAAPAAPHHYVGRMRSPPPPLSPPPCILSPLGRPRLPKPRHLPPLPPVRDTTWSACRAGGDNRGRPVRNAVVRRKWYVGLGSVAVAVVVGVAAAAVVVVGGGGGVLSSLMLFLHAGVAAWHPRV
jgi:hypothetical protein